MELLSTNYCDASMVYCIVSANPRDQKGMSSDRAVTYLLYRDRDKIATIAQTSSSNPYSNFIEIIPRIPLTKTQYSFNNIWMPHRQPAILSTNNGLIYWCVCAFLDLNELFIVALVFPYRHWFTRKFRKLNKLFAFDPWLLYMFNAHHEQDFCRSFAKYK